MFCTAVMLFVLEHPLEHEETMIAAPALVWPITIAIIVIYWLMWLLGKTASKALKVIQGPSKQ